MSLRQVAGEDLIKIIGGGFGWNITITNPAGISAAVTGFANDIAQSIDPDTGLIVSGRIITVALSLKSLEDAGFTALPEGISEATQKPWLIDFADIRGNLHNFAVIGSHPDRALGLVTCELELYNA